MSTTHPEVGRRVNVKVVVNHKFTMMEGLVKEVMPAWEARDRDLIKGRGNGIVYLIEVELESGEMRHIAEFRSKVKTINP